jgi:4-hydroxy-tetrahydrodipicolinate synthase
MTDFKGSFTALITPFTANGDEVNEDGLRRLVDFVIDGGVHGLVANGSTGEFASQTLDERKRVVEIVVQQANKRVPVLAHTGSMTAKTSIELTKHAESAGADGIMAVAPFYEPLNIDEAKRYYLDIAAETSLDLMIYNLPIATGVRFEPEDVVDLNSKAANIRYIKDTTFDWTQAARLIHDYSDVISTFVGLDTMYAAVLLEGAAGSIVGASNFIPKELSAIYNAVQRGDYAEVKEIWSKIFPVMHFMTTVGYPNAVKAAMQAIGFDLGDPRRPLEPLTAEQRAALEKALQASE